MQGERAHCRSIVGGMRRWGRMPVENGEGLGRKAQLFGRRQVAALRGDGDGMIRYKTDLDKVVVTSNLKRRGWEEVTCVLDDDW
jgi:hypothetical protein